MLSQAHITKVFNRYGIDAGRTDQLRSIDNQQIADHYGRSDSDGGGIEISYNPSEPLLEQILRVRLDNPIADAKTGRKIRYLSPPGQRNALYIPAGVTFAERMVILTEGEFKALAGWQQGLQCVALAGVWNWRLGSELDGIRLSDRDALIPELKRDWSNQDFCLIYDSDIDQTHSAWTAFPRLAEQLYALGAESVKIMSLPPVGGGNV